MIMIDDIIGCDIAGLMPWRTPWEYEDNMHHDTFLEQRAAHSPTASRGNSPPNTPPLSRQGSYRQSGDRSSFRLAERRPESGPTGEGLLSPLAESLRLTTMTGQRRRHMMERLGRGRGIWSWKVRMDLVKQVAPLRNGELVSSLTCSAWHCFAAWHHFQSIYVMPTCQLQIYKLWLIHQVVYTHIHPQ